MNRIFLIILLAGILQLSTSLVQAGNEKIDKDLLAQMQGRSTGEWDVIVEFKPPPSAKAAASVTGMEQTPKRTAIVRQRWIDEAETTQAKVIQSIKPKLQQAATARNSKKDPYVSLWITNELFIPSASADIINSIAEVNENVALIRETISFPIMRDKTPPGTTAPAPAQKKGRQFNNLPEGLRTMQVGEWWDKGFNGTGVIVGHIDSGVDLDHEGVRYNWLGKKGGWYDPLGGMPLPYESDKNETHGSHGTHTIGTLIGKYVGVAPEARWISCKGTNGNGFFNEFAIKRCGEFMVCPNPHGDVGEGCKFKPSVVSNSYGFPHDPARPGVVTVLDGVISKWHEQGIIPVFAAGNSGADGCVSLYHPATHEDVLTVGAESARELAPYSSMGPPETRHPDYDAKGFYKPDFVATGSLVNSTVLGGKYRVESGTSQATPYVAGAIALILSRTENLTYAQVKKILLDDIDNSNLRSSTGPCGGKPDTTFPNHKFGVGKVLLPADPDDIGFPVKRPSREIPRLPFTGDDDDDNETLTTSTPKDGGGGGGRKPTIAKSLITLSVLRIIWLY